MADKASGNKRRGPGLLKTAQVVAFLLVTAAVLGFSAYAGRVLSYAETGESADAVIALTGGEGRLGAAAALLADGRGERLLISGVHPSVRLDELRAATGASAALFECCVDLGREAADTIGNALETAEWARANGYSRLLVVTSDYHLPRSLLELKAAMPDAELIPYPVRTPRPWSDLRAARRWAQEYPKYVAVLARSAFAASGRETREA
ncbi:MAG: YdcF family protein [Maricaulaceae bacterium]|nr:YdcF family protein [Maricaulaceae bacterium]